MYRIIIDNKTLLNDIIDTDSYVYKIIEDGIGQKLQPIISIDMKTEAEEKADEKIDDSDAVDLLEEYFKACEEIEISGKTNIVDDKNVNELVATAESGDADFVITENSDLLDLDEYKGIQMLTPEQFWSMYQEDEGTEDSEDF